MDLAPLRFLRLSGPDDANVESSTTFNAASPTVFDSLVAAIVLVFLIECSASTDFRSLTELCEAFDTALFEDMLFLPLLIRFSCTMLFDE